jgi:hypothetical protein
MLVMLNGLNTNTESLTMASRSDSRQSPIQPGGVAWQVQHLEAGYAIALGQRVRDLHGTAVHPLEHPRRQCPHQRVADLRVVEVMLAGVIALDVGDLVGMTEHGRAELRGSAAMVGVRVADHDALDRASLVRGALDRRRHLDAARLEDGDPVAVADQINVRQPLGAPRRTEPKDLDALRDLLYGHRPTARTSARSPRA